MTGIRHAGKKLQVHQSFSGIWLGVEELIRFSFCHKGHFCEATFQLWEFVCKGESEKLRQFDSIQLYTEKPFFFFFFFAVSHLSKSFLCLVNYISTTDRNVSPWYLVVNSSRKKNAFPLFSTGDRIWEINCLLDVLEVWPILWKRCPNILTALTAERHLLIWWHSNTDGVWRQMISNG